MQAEPLLEVRDLSVEFHTAAGAVRAVRNVSWHIDHGETLAILGESGSGKSVSALAVMGLIDTPPGHITNGAIRFDGEDLLALPAARRRAIFGRRIAMIFQDPLAALNPVYSVGWQVAEVLRVHDASGGDPWPRTVALLERVGIPDAAERAGDYPHQFSGGQRQRIMIAMAIALKPALLIADEPTTALDVTVQAQILELLKDLQRETQMGLVLITHDLGVVAGMADRVAVMTAGEVVESGAAADVLRAPRHSYTQRLLSAVPGRLPFRPRTERPEPLLEARGLSKSYEIGPSFLRRGTKVIHALEDVSFTVAPRETLGIVGESGSGKTTLSRVLLGLTAPSRGQALFKSRDMHAMADRDLFELRRRIQVVFQDPTASLNPRMSVEEIVSEPMAIHRDILPRARWGERVAELLVQVGLNGDHARRYPHQFSGGQRQRIAIARALAASPDLVICDEAVSALDVSVQAQVIELLKSLQREHGLAYIFIAHDLPVVRDFADRVLVMQRGRVVEQGPTEAIFTRPEHPYTRQLLASCPSVPEMAVRPEVAA